MIIIRGECLKREAYKINDTPLLVQYFMELVKMRTTTNQQIVLSMQRMSHQYTSIVRMKNLFTTLGNNVNESKLPKWVTHLPFYFLFLHSRRSLDFGRANSLLFQHIWEVDEWHPFGARICIKYKWSIRRKIGLANRMEWQRQRRRQRDTRKTKFLWLNRT